MENTPTIIEKRDLPFLIEDINDYLFENQFNIGTNFKDAFPHSYIQGQQIHLVNTAGKVVATVTVSLPMKRKSTTRK